MTYPLNVVPKSSAIMSLSSPSKTSRAAVYGGGSMDAHWDNTHRLRQLVTPNICPDRVVLIIKNELTEILPPSERKTMRGSSVLLSLPSSIREGGVTSARLK